MHRSHDVILRGQYSEMFTWSEVMIGLTTRRPVKKNTKNDVEHLRRLGLKSCLILLFSILTSPIHAQDNARPVSEKWRPKDGLYGSLGKTPPGDCDENEALTIAIDKNSVGGNEWGCTISKITDTGRSSIRLDMACNDLNLAQSLFPHDEHAEEHVFKEIMLISRIDDGTISVRMTSNGKFSSKNGWRVSYCSTDQQRIAAGQPPEPWQPQDGVYAAPGSDFDEQCRNATDTILDLPARKLSSGPDQCNAYSYNDATLRDPILQIVCNETNARKGLIEKDIGGGHLFGPPGFEVMKIQRIDDKTISLQKTHGDEFKAPPRQVAYCSAEAQRRYIEQRHKVSSVKNAKAPDLEAVSDVSAVWGLQALTGLWAESLQFDV